MTLLLTLLVMAVVAVVVAVAVGRITGGLDRPASSLPGRGLPPGPVTADDVERVRFSPALRGYRMDEVDDVVDRLTEELRRRDAENAQLRVRAAFGHPPFGETLVTGPPGVPGASSEAGESVEAATQEPGDAWRRPASDDSHHRHEYGDDHPDPFPPSNGAPTSPPTPVHDEHRRGR
ncbi:MAG: DivIVA domain-containing protein [Kineosporiaceae bacterium]